MHNYLDNLPLNSSNILQVQAADHFSLSLGCRCPVKKLVAHHVKREDRNHPKSRQDHICDHAPAWSFFSTRAGPGALATRGVAMNSCRRSPHRRAGTDCWRNLLFVRGDASHSGGWQAGSRGKEIVVEDPVHRQMSAPPSQSRRSSVGRFRPIKQRAAWARAAVAAAAAAAVMAQPLGTFCSSRTRAARAGPLHLAA